MANNAKIASLLRQIASLLDEQGVAFKPNAYRKAATVVEELKEDVSTYKDEKALMELPGIGEAIASKIREYLTTGHIKFLDGLLAEQGGLSAELMQVEDLGPKRVRQLQTELGITTVAQLIKAAEEGKLQSLPRLSDTLEKKILENARMVSERSKRFPLAEVEPDVQAILETVRKLPGVEKAEAAGSYRRKKATVGDVDILIITNETQAVSEAVSKLPFVVKVVAQGGTKLSFNLKSGLRVDVRFVEPSQWGSALLYFTGDKEHNITLRKIAIKKNWKLNEYGLFEGTHVIASKTEEDIYKALGLPWIDPTERRGELPA